MCYLLPGQHADPEDRFQIREWYGFGGLRPQYELFGAEDRATGELVHVKVFPIGEWEAGGALGDLGRICDLEHESLIRPIEFGSVPDEACPFYTGPLLYVAEPAQAGASLEHFLDGDPPADAVEPVLDSIVEGFEYLRRAWRLCDIPPREIVLVRRSRPRWSLVGAESASGLPNVLETLSRLYPPLAGRMAPLRAN